MWFSTAGLTNSIPLAHHAPIQDHRFIGSAPPAGAGSQGNPRPLIADQWVIYISARDPDFVVSVWHKSRSRAQAAKQRWRGEPIK
jgi:hypothetical protein